ncbi:MULTISPECIES: MipA/OmpV family protein [unclassified Uliginosibacterium]|uniref:MipA/OmpV family protein n=1 Tax=unclassified Uliginosibacterium TaxID=2621521 RepID=UPI000C7A905A|nr:MULTISPECIES: MipA/OmpV family protein [unclassified Uliginosibacterium]MDO6387565.1 MipA/OmpV family protein [Uliginosibacterium sp. 31-12]PLK47889.1 MipA/OmpV family protein [Uliginosibacterium sp. TH139]
MKALLLFLLLLALPAQAELKPRWELGMGVAAATLPDYRGSDEASEMLLPFPYAAYRFDWLKADRNGVRATLFDSDKVELNLSAGATPPVKSKNNQARQGMSDLKPMIEFGPSLDFKLWQSDNQDTRLDLRLPARAAFELREGMHYSGWLFSPRLNLDFLNVGLPEGWRVGLVTGPTFQDKHLNAYFYSVDEQYARADRPAYSASGGYTGWQFLGAVSRKFGKTWVGAYARWDTLKGAAFEDSPLVRRKTYFTAGIGVTWTLAQSSEMVEVGDD